jgi:hypothetical protein
VSDSVCKSKSISDTFSITLSQLLKNLQERNPDPVFRAVVDSWNYCSQQGMFGKTRHFRRKRKNYARTDLEEVDASSARKLQSFNQIGYC